MYKLLIINLLSLSIMGCGRTLISEQSSPKLSAVTMYCSVNGHVLEGVSIKNLKTGNVYYNKKYGWGKEFFPKDREFSFLSIGNVESGTYSLNKVIFWYFPPGKNDKVNVDIVIPDDIFQFVITDTDILYLGDFRLFILSLPPDHPSLIDKIGQLKAKGYSAKVFSTSLRHLVAPADILYINGTEPSEANKFARPGEEFFWRFFISKKSSIPHWAKISERKVKQYLESEQNMLDLMVEKP